MDIVILWGKTVKQAVDRYAKQSSKEDKQDYEQDCFVQILEFQDAVEKILKEQGLEAAKKYVYGICHNKITDIINPDRYPKSVITADSIDDPVVKRQVQNHATEYESVLGVSETDLDSAVKQLPRTEQHVIRSLYFHNMSERDLARSVGKTQWWVQQIKKFAIADLKRILESK